MTAGGGNALKFVKSNIQTNIHKIGETAYGTYVRPLLEYSTTVLDPWQKKYINQIEMVQHRAVCYIFNDYNFTSSVAQSVTCLATDASLTAGPGVASSIPARSHTFVEIDHEIISTVILLPSAESFKKGCCQLQAKVCARSTG